MIIRVVNDIVQFLASYFCALHEMGPGSETVDTVARTNMPVLNHESVTSPTNMEGMDSRRAPVKGEKMERVVKKKNWMAESRTRKSRLEITITNASGFSFVVATYWQPRSGAKTAWG